MPQRRRFPSFDIRPIGEKFKQALAANHLPFTEERRLLFNIFVLLTETPVTLDELTAELLAKYGPRGSVCKYPLSGSSVAETMEIMLAAGVAKEVEPEKPSRCPTCHNLLIDFDGEGWHCQDCGAMEPVKRRFIPLEGPLIHEGVPRPASEPVIWAKGRRRLHLVE